jgi:hypothetical protein
MDSYLQSSDIFTEPLEAGDGVGIANAVSTACLISFKELLIKNLVKSLISELSKY